MPRLFTKYQGNFIFQNRFLPIARQPNCAKKIFYPRYGTLGVQGSIWFFGAETPQSGVILVAGREPGCLVCLAAAAFLLPKNSAGPAGGQKSGLARPQDEGGLNLPPRTRTKPALIWAVGRHIALCTPRAFFYGKKEAIFFLFIWLFPRGFLLKN